MLESMQEGVKKFSEDRSVFKGNVYSVGAALNIGQYRKLWRIYVQRFQRQKEKEATKISTFTTLLQSNQPPG